MGTKHLYFIYTEQTFNLKTVLRFYITLGSHCYFQTMRLVHPFIEVLLHERATIALALDLMHNLQEKTHKCVTYLTLEIR